MKRRKQIGKLIYTPRWDQGDVQLSEDYEGLSREDKLALLACWISVLLSMRNAMIPNPQSWHHFMGDRLWVGLSLKEIQELAEKNHRSFHPIDLTFAQLIAAKIKEKNT